VEAKPVGVGLGCHLPCRGVLLLFHVSFIVPSGWRTEARDEL
jgi:hypothetical protein